MRRIGYGCAGLALVLLAAIVWAGTTTSVPVLIDGTGRLTLRQNLPLLLQPDADQNVEVTTSGSGVFEYNDAPVLTGPYTLQNAFDAGTTGSKGRITGCSLAERCEYRGATLKYQLYENAGVWYVEVRQISDDALVAIDRNIDDGLTHQILGNSVPIVTYDGTAATQTFHKAATYDDGIKQTFNPNATNAGLNVGAHTADPSSPANGDILYNATTNKFRCRENGAWVDCIGSGGAGDVEAVWGCTTGDCSTLTAAAGDSLDGRNADSIIPMTESTSLPATCTPGQLHRDLDSGGTTVYLCYATNSWAKVGEPLEVAEIDGTPTVTDVWKINVSNGTLTDNGNGEVTITTGGTGGGPTSRYLDAIALVPDGTNCVAGIITPNGSQPTDVIYCADSASSVFAGKVLVSDIGGCPAGALTFTLWLYHSTTESNTVWHGDFQAQYRRPASTDVINSTYSTPDANSEIILTIGTAHEIESDTATLTPNGTCSDDALLLFKFTIDPTPTTANMSITTPVNFVTGIRVAQ